MAETAERTVPGPGRQSGRAPLAPGAWPLIGHMPAMIRRPLDFITSLPAHGDVLKIRFGPMSVYAVNHPELLQLALVEKQHEFERGRFFKKMSLVMGEGILSTSGQTHRRLRRKLQPAFHHSRIPGYSVAIRQVAKELMADWRPGRVIALDKEMDRYSLDSVTGCLFAGSLPSSIAAEFRRTLPIVSRGFIVRAATPDQWGRVPTPGNRRFDRALRDLRAAASQAVAAYRADAAEDDNSLLAMMAQSGGEDGETLTDRQVRDNVINFGIAGMETTGATLAWLFYELSRHPEVEARVLAEIDEVLGDRDPDHEDLAKLAYTGRVVKETLRVHAPWILMRRARNDIRLGGVTVPEGAEILYSPHMVHHDARWYPDPYRFDPDRWLAEPPPQVPRAAWMAFSVGAHKCIGDAFAITEMTIAVAMICRRWRLRPLPGVEIRPVVRAGIHPNRMPVTAEPRGTA
ncbi:cytochrome P450 [Streptomyces aidingensis]|uniref:Cytochrome P450 n=1 Tax=Streptomyces aidingensis TaxID=910347 RepID=A0A1I1J1P0_9ACTN|nr:cytochrome P450 [Streptomyces aidingensis]SFC40538.1 Cytochrome P450 [Streptomyces aidingensis]